MMRRLQAGLSKRLSAQLMIATNWDAGFWGGRDSRLPMPCPYGLQAGFMRYTWPGDMTGFLPFITVTKARQPMQNSVSRRSLPAMKLLYYHGSIPRRKPMNRAGPLLI